jgi:hypothetical protein
VSYIIQIERRRYDNRKREGEMVIERDREADERERVGDSKRKRGEVVIERE